MMAFEQEMAALKEEDAKKEEGERQELWANVAWTPSCANRDRLESLEMIFQIERYI